MKKNKENKENKDSRIIYCTFLRKNTEGFQYQFYPGDIGIKIYNEISKEAWKKWSEKQIKIINEKNLNMFSKTDRIILEKYMKEFLFK